MHPDTVSERCFAANRHFEGLFNRDYATGVATVQPNGTVIPYRCIAGKRTIGFGCTHDVTPDMRFSAEEVDARLKWELETHYIPRAKRLIKVPLTPDQFDAIVMFDFNCGGLTVFDPRTKKSKPSGALLALNAGQLDAVPAQMMRWTKFRDPVTKDVKDSPGLLRRRRAECALWRGIYADVPSAPSAVEQIAAKQLRRPAEAPIPQAVSAPAPAKPLAETTTAAVQTGQTLAGLGVGGIGVLELMERVDKLGFVAKIADRPAALGLIAVGLGITAGAAWQFRDRARKLLMGV